MKKPYFTTADGVAVKGNDRVFCIGILASDFNKKSVYPDVCKIAIRTNMDENIFSTRSAAQAECDKRNSI